MNAAIVIPARLESTRLPRKLLLDQTGKTLIQHTYEAACKSTQASQVLVAVDDQELLDAVNSFSTTAGVMTSSEHPSGTDRVAEVARKIDCDVLVNVQGDEPEVEARHIDRLIQVFRDHPEIQCATLAAPIRKIKLVNDPSCVKVVFNQKNQALYFSRSPIPYARDSMADWHTHDPPVYWQHVGMYAYRKEFLIDLSQRRPVALERVEMLEQLRILDHGDQIFVQTVDQTFPGIDTLADYEAFVRRQ